MANVFSGNYGGHQCTKLKSSGERNKNLSIRDTENCPNYMQDHRNELETLTELIICWPKLQASCIF